MAGLSGKRDAFGQEIYDHYRGQEAVEIVERDDGYVALSGGPGQYFAPFGKWPARQRQAIRLARGRVLDVGCGAGRAALYLQKRGFDVLGIDNSALAVKTCRLRGLKQARVLPIAGVGPRLGTFDTVLMFGNNFGLFGSFAGARRLLRRFHRLTTDRARIIAETRDPYQTTEPAHLGYHRRNRRRGRMTGQLRIRIRHGLSATPFFDYLMVSRQELREIVRGTGWHVARLISPGGPMYMMVLEKDR